MLTDEQLAERHRYIGASEAAAALGLNKYKTPLGLWLEKTGRESPDRRDFGPGTPAYWGQLIEQAIADTYAAKHDVKLRKSGTLIHKEYPFIAATPDREVIGKRMLLECKVSSPWRTDWGESGTDDVPPEYIVQCHQQMAVRGWTENGCDLALFRSSADYREYHIDFDPEFWDHCLLRLKKFWNMVEDDVRPDIKTMADLQQIHPYDTGGSLMADTDLMKLHAMVLQTKKAYSGVKKIKDEAEEKLKIAIGANAQIVDESNRVLATWRSAKDTEKTDYRQVIHELSQLEIPELQEIVDRNTETRHGSRRLIVKENIE